MKFCSKCGKEVMEEAVVCPNCGCALASVAARPNPSDETVNTFGWGALGFCVPIAGLILYLIWKDSAPKKSKSAGVGALISVGVSVVFYIIYAIILAGMMASL